MKANDKPQLSTKWWKSEKPPEIKGADLEKALASAEKALAGEKKMSEPATIDACQAALGHLQPAVAKTIKKECDKKKHKDVIAVLNKYAALIKAELSRLEGAKKKAAQTATEEEDEGESDDKILQADYLYKMIKLLGSTGKEVNFGFGLDTKNPAASKLVLTRKGKPERLFKTLKKTGQFSSRLLTYGTALPDPQDGKTLILKLSDSAGEPPQIQKLGRLLLRSDKKLRFRKLKLVLPGGQTIEDNEPDTDEEKQVTAAESASASSAGGGGSRLSDQDRETVRNDLDEMERRLDELIAEYGIHV